jgi:hypothetical protein
MRIKRKEVNLSPKTNLLFAFCCLMIGFAVYCLGAEQKSAETKKTPWRISGQLEEACKCNPACPCWFGQKPTHMNCGGQLVYFITKGNYGNVSLDGLAYARAAQSPDGKSMMETAGGNWIFDYLYIDEKATPEQRNAIKEIAYATEAKESPKVEVRFVPITRTVDGKVHHVTIGEYGSFSAQLMDSVLGGAPKITHAPGADPIRAEFEQGVTTAFQYKDASQAWNTQGSNYMFTNFDVNSDQYEKFTAHMMQMMQDMKKEAGEHKH